MEELLKQILSNQILMMKEMTLPPSQRNFIKINSVIKQSENVVLGAVTSRYLFWFDDEGKEGWTFEIEAKNYEEAYEKAYDTHGPQVEGMMYQIV